MDVKFPNGVAVRAVGIRERATNADWRTFGLYLDARWLPTWPAQVIAWRDFGLPECWLGAADAIHRAYDRARTGERVEIGCAGGLGRTGTVLACMAILSGVPSDEAVGWVRTNYDSRAVETVEQEEWVRWFAGRARLINEHRDGQATEQKNG